MTQRIKKVILFGRKAGMIEAINFLNDKKIKINLIITKKKEIYGSDICELARKLGIPIFETADEVKLLIEKKSDLIKDIDLLISYLYWQKITTPFLKLAKKGAINFHPAPLPDYKGRAGYNTAILANKTYFGVSAHFIDSEKLDDGPIIKVIRFKISPTDNAHSLEKKTQKHLIKLLKNVIEMLISGKTKVKKNIGGTYLTLAKLEELKKIDLRSDNAKIIDKKVKAFFFPPYTGAYITVDGKKYTLINEEILIYLNKLLSDNHETQKN